MSKYLKRLRPSKQSDAHFISYCKSQEEVKVIRIVHFNKLNSRIVSVTYVKL